MKSFYNITVFILIVAAVAIYFWPPFAWSLVIIIPIILVGIMDIIQPSQTIRRNFPVIGRMRYLAEWMRPKIYQYFIE